MPCPANILGVICPSASCERAKCRAAVRVATLLVRGAPHVECGGLPPLFAARACPGVLLASTSEPRPRLPPSAVGLVAGQSANNSGRMPSKLTWRDVTHPPGINEQLSHYGNTNTNTNTKATPIRIAQHICSVQRHTNNSSGSLGRGPESNLAPWGPLRPILRKRCHIRNIDIRPHRNENPKRTKIASLSPIT